MGSSNIRFELLNKGAGTADLNTFHIKLAISTAKDNNGVAIQGIALYYTENASVYHNSVIGGSISSFTTNKQRLGPSEIVEIEKIFLDMPY
jgi:hypothetical protein